MQFMTLKYYFEDNTLAELSSSGIKFWPLTGIPVYEGSIDGFKEAFPAHFKILEDNKVIWTN